jgi:hypothetical protein
VVFKTGRNPTEYSRKGDAAPENRISHLFHVFVELKNSTKLGIRLDYCCSSDSSDLIYWSSLRLYGQITMSKREQQSTVSFSKTSDNFVADTNVILSNIKI